MALVKISALPPVGAAALTDILPEVQPPVGGTTFKVSLQQILTLFNTNIQISESQVTNLTTDLAGKVSRSGDTMLGFLILNADPVAALGAATKQYVDNAISALNVIPAVYAASTALIVSITYSNGASGIGATITNTGALVSFSIDGISPPLNSRILVKDQVTQLQNGIYTLTTVGSAGVPWVLTRATDYDQPSEIKAGDLVVVNNGTLNSGTGWIERSTVTTIGVDAITFTQFGGIAFPLALDKGGTNASLTASNGGIFYSTATAGAILSGTSTANQLLRSGSNSAPAWTTATYPITTTINQMLYSSSNNVVTGLASAASSVMTTNGSSIPAFSTTLPAGLTIPGYALSGANADITSLNAMTGVIKAPTAIQSAAGENELVFNYVGSAVNYITISNNNLTGSPFFGTAGADPIIALEFSTKGGPISISDSTNTNGARINFYNAAHTHGTVLNVAAAQATDVTLTLPAADGSANSPLVTNGSGTLSFLTQAAITKVASQQFTASGTYTPTTGMKYCIVECVGGGGAGGGSTSSAGQVGGGGGGGGGGYARSILTAADIGASKAVTIGAGGTVGAAGANNGNAGGTTSLGALVIALGGGGGAGAGSPGAGGGAAGGQASGATSNIIAINGGSGNYGFGASIITITGSGGFGGSSFYGAGGATNARGSGGVTAGFAGSNYGGGGSGGVSNNGGGAINTTGGAGGPGIVIITEYISI